MPLANRKIVRVDENRGFDLGPDKGADSGGAARHVIAVVVGAAVLYEAKAVLMPLALAAIIALVLSPAVTRLERWLGRIAASALIVLLAIFFVGGTSYFLTLELTAVARDVTSYSNNIVRKINGLKQTAPPVVRKIEKTLHNIKRKIEGSNAGRAHVPVVEAVKPESLTGWLSPTLPLLATLFEAFIVVVLMFFLLYDRRSLRDQFVRVAARARITIPSQAIDTASYTVSHYLLIYSGINFLFGLLIGLACWMLGLPRPELWGALSFLLRYIPYVGAIASAALPTIVAFAVFPGWMRAFEILAIYIVLDQSLAQFLEPFLIGAGVGVSPVALLLSAIFWAWLWGPVGLLLSTPFVVCFKVGGDYIPALGFFSILLGASQSTAGPHDYYRRLLELDRHGAHTLAVRYADEHGIASAFQDILAPALELAAEERDKNNIDEGKLRLVREHARETIIHLADRAATRPQMAHPRVLGVAAAESGPLELLMLLELLRVDGFTARLAAGGRPAAGVRHLIAAYEPELICLSCSGGDHLASAIDLAREIRQEFQDIAIIAFGSAAGDARRRLQKAGCGEVCRDMDETRRAVWLFATRRAAGAHA